MKDCGDCRESILLYLNKSLSVSQVIEFRAHLKICEACRQVVEAEEELSHLWSFARALGVLTHHVLSPTMAIHSSMVKLCCRTTQIATRISSKSADSY